MRVTAGRPPARARTPRPCGARPTARGNKERPRPKPPSRRSARTARCPSPRCSTSADRKRRLDGDTASGPRRERDAAAAAFTRTPRVAGRVAGGPRARGRPRAGARLRAHAGGAAGRAGLRRTRAPTCGRLFAPHPVPTPRVRLLLSLVHALSYNAITAYRSLHLLLRC